MTNNTRYGTWRKVLILAAWSVVALGCITLLVAAIRRQNHAQCKGLRITIEGTMNRSGDSTDARDIAEVKDIITEHNTRDLVGIPTEAISTKRLEQKIRQSPWVRKAELFFDSKQVLWVKVTEREPVARLFTVASQSFYLDSSGVRLPLRDYRPMKLPVFTSCPLDKKTWSAADSLLVREMSVLSGYLLSHPFWMDMIQQVEVTGQRQFDIVPTVGSSTIRLGDTSALDEKFHRLWVFYRQVAPKVGWNKYAALDVRFTGQVIGVKKEALQTTIDTARAADMLRVMIARGKIAMQDTVVKTTAAPRDLTPNIDSTRDL